MIAPLAAAWLVALLIGAGVFGLLIGSFLNVVAYRVPAGLSIVSPPSACPGCGGRIRPYDNIPVLSWLILRGRCRDCGEPISARYPVVEAVTGVFFVAVAVMAAPALATAASTQSTVAAVLQLVAFLYLAAVSVVLAAIDIDTRTLPNAIVLPSAFVGIVLLSASALLAQRPGALLTAVTGMIGLFLFYLIVALVSPRGMGFGDVKLAGVLGWYLGFLGVGPLLVGAFAAFLLGGLFGIVLLVTGRAGRKSGIPFGPWMLAGAWIGVVAGGPLWSSYLALVGLT
ncbi:prepilin peptidase [Leifsonia poae]|uniref:prepilin peptidase n=1 Tax=Leifsonia poae TaxID=110933 RepID=UPI001CC1A5EA|nr:A24 family peptidase [Leifsonia poae]